MTYLYKQKTINIFALTLLFSSCYFDSENTTISISKKSQDNLINNQVDSQITPEESEESINQNQPADLDQGNNEQVSSNEEIDIDSLENTPSNTSSKIVTISSPANNSILENSELRLELNGDAQYIWLDIGSEKKPNEFYSNYLTDRNQIFNIPLNGQNIYVWIWTYIDNQWHKKEYQFKTVNNEKLLVEESDLSEDTDQSVNENNLNPPENKPSNDISKIKKCPIGSELSILSEQYLVARMGSVYSTTLYNPFDKSQSNNSHNPQKLQVGVSNNNSEVVCDVHWQSKENNQILNGWVFPELENNNNAWWVAGEGIQQEINATIYLEDNSSQTVTFYGDAQPHTTRSNSTHINWSSEQWDWFSVDVTPLTMPETTYYSAINFPGGYTGLQTNKYLFSVWDTNGIDAEIIDPGIATCEGFGGEGTGAKCYVLFEPNINQTYRFEVEVSYPIENRTDYSMYFTDLLSGQRTFVAKLRYGKREYPRGAAGFVENWWQTGENCLDTKERSVYFHNIRYKNDNQTPIPITSARSSAVYNQWHNEVCANYYFGSEDGKFLWSSGGNEKISAPLNLPGYEFNRLIELE